MKNGIHLGDPHYNVHSPRPTRQNAAPNDLLQGILFAFVLIALLLLGSLLNGAIADAWAMLQRVLTSG